MGWPLFPWLEIALLQSQTAKSSRAQLGVGGRRIEMSGTLLPDGSSCSLGGHGAAGLKRLPGNADVAGPEEASEPGGAAANGLYAMEV